MSRQMMRFDQVVPALDRWLATTFTPDRIEDTLDRIVEAQPGRRPRRASPRHGYTSAGPDRDDSPAHRSTTS
jgi:hypothetical protein